MDRFILLLLGIATLFAIITYLLWRISPRLKIIKYVPSLLSLVGGLYFFYLARTVRIGNGFEDLANFIFAIMLLTGFISGVVMGVILDYVLPRYKS